MNSQHYYLCKSLVISSRRYDVVLKISKRIFKKIERRTKRRAYIRSPYFKGDKIFFDYFWVHLYQKAILDRLRRLRYFECAIELISENKCKPISESSNRKSSEILYRFLGKTRSTYFVVQIKEDVKRKQKYFVSVFEYKK